MAIKPSEVAFGMKLLCLISKLSDIFRREGLIWISPLLCPIPYSLLLICYVLPHLLMFHYSTIIFSFLFSTAFHQIRSCQIFSVWNGIDSNYRFTDWIGFKNIVMEHCKNLYDPHMKVEDTKKCMHEAAPSYLKNQDEWQDDIKKLRANIVESCYKCSNNTKEEFVKMKKNINEKCI